MTGWETSGGCGKQQKFWRSCGERAGETEFLVVPILKPIQQLLGFAEIFSAMRSLLSLLRVCAQGNVIRVKSTMISRPVQHHFDDLRPSSEGGTCYKYKLFHKPAATVSAPLPLLFHSALPSPVLNN
jgi:hypothetical protein